MNKTPMNAHGNRFADVADNPEIAVSPFSRIEAIAKGTPCSFVTRSVLCDTAGTANLTMATGAAVDNVPLQKGYNPLMIQGVRVGGSAAGLWACS